MTQNEFMEMLAKCRDEAEKQLAAAQTLGDTEGQHEWGVVVGGLDAATAAALRAPVWRDV